MSPSRIVALAASPWPGRRPAVALHRAKGGSGGRLSRFRVQLKSDENNLKILNDSTLKKQQDNKELISKLKNTINQLNIEINALKEKSKINNSKNKSSINYINIYEQKILSMKNTIKDIDFQKNKYLEENANLHVEIKTKQRQ